MFGSATEHAVADFQRANGLTPSGVVGATTARYLGVATGSSAAPASTTGSSASSASASSGGGLRRGSEGSSVRALQTRLAGFGYVVEHDGVFGRLTERAVEHFQRANGLTPSGVVDTATARDLGLTAQLARRTATTSGSSLAATASASSGGLRRGSQGSSVRALQRASPGSATSSSTTACSAASPSAPSSTSSAQRTHAERRRRHRNLPRPRPHQRQPARRRAVNASGGALSVGSQGDAVARIQRQLQRAGFAVIGGADGAFGPSPAPRSGPSSGPTGSRSPAGSTPPRRAPSAPVAPARR